ncbi:KpsF/GutQ family sugar-phosphate isomerase [Compostibacter hankyongensis]|uniref:KpsF/GutQ family sugar-phosphate isomerase n=1 Tax=Compostibacter hankyongensis TaxID=1007089 RepID=A0ABP8FC39_9BACT
MIKETADTDPLAVARQTLLLEAEAIRGLIPQLNDDFNGAVRMLMECRGRVVVTGIGKSALIARKIVATFNSTGTPAVFMHAADAIHGDLGMVQPGDVVLCISKSGVSPEIKVLVPLLKSFKNPLIAMTGNKSAYLAIEAAYVLDTAVSREACPNNLAPTASTTVQLAMGDALAVSLMRLRGFTGEDFARFHPGGTLGKQLYLRVGDLAARNARPRVPADAPLQEVIVEMTEKRLGMTVVTDDRDGILGVITDGDLRRMLNGRTDWQQVRATDIMTIHPKTVEAGEMAVTALALMREHNITQLVVVTGGTYTGVIHLHDLIKEGII